MKRLSGEFKLFAITLYWLCFANVVKAQIIPDATLPVNSTITPGCSVCTIEGGTTRGSNLFHSFSQFSVPTGAAALFNNDVNIQNILTRVTGTNVSNIDGVIQAKGGANLFIINPNGIVLGANAKLNIGGSFVGTTATSVSFADGTEFSAIIPNAPLLTISTPIGLNLINNNAAITVHGSGHSLSMASLLAPVQPSSVPNASELRVQPQNTLALIAGNILLDGGILAAPSGRIELGGVENGTVKLNITPRISFDYTEISNFGDIELKRSGLADVSGFNSGSIQVQGRSIDIRDGALLFAQNFGFLPSGSIDVNASDVLRLVSQMPYTFMRTGIMSENYSLGKSADINVIARQVSIEDGAAIVNRTFGTAGSGNINVNATELIKITGFSLLNPSVTSTISATTSNSGRAGDVNVSTAFLSLVNAGTISTTNINNGLGGNITVNADVVKIGDTNFMTIPSSLTAPNFGTGNAGSLTVNTRTLSIYSGGQVSTPSFNSGNAGTIIINASEFVEVSGKVPRYPSSINSAVQQPNILAGQILGLFDRPLASSGSVTINTRSLKISDEGNVAVTNEGIGRGGNITINAESVLLTDNSSVVAATVSGEGGNISFKVRDLQMRRGSSITTNAGGNGSGGNMNIDTNTLIAFENSDITANSQDSRGGKVTINAQVIFGTKFRTLLTPQSDITATSALGAEFNGVVDINTIDTDPGSGLVELPETMVDRTQQISATCSTLTSNKFIMTGTGGLPSSPDDLMVQQTEITEPFDLISSQTLNTVNFTPRQEIIEAKTLVVNKGEVFLVAQAPGNKLYSPIISKPVCNNAM